MRHEFALRNFRTEELTDAYFPPSRSAAGQASALNSNPRAPANRPIHGDYRRAVRALLGRRDLDHCRNTSGPLKSIPRLLVKIEDAVSAAVSSKYLPSITEFGKDVK